MSSYYQQRQAARDFWRDVLIGFLLVIFFSMMLWDLFGLHTQEAKPTEMAACQSDVSLPVYTRPVRM